MVRDESRRRRRRQIVRRRGEEEEETQSRKLGYGEEQNSYHPAQPDPEGAYALSQPHGSPKLATTRHRIDDDGEREMD
jgi:hypothetical protein